MKFWLELTLYILVVTVISPHAEATDLTRRRVLGLFAATATAAVTGMPSFANSPATTAALGSATNIAPPASIPWGWIRSISSEASACTVDEVFCLIHPADRIDLIDRHYNIVMNYTEIENISLDQIERLDVARRQLVRMRQLEQSRLAFLEELAEQQQQTLEQLESSQKPLQSVALLDLVSRHLPIERLNRIRWQMAYPDDEIINNEDLVAIEQLVNEAGWSESLIVFSDAHSSDSCEVELSK